MTVSICKHIADILDPTESIPAEFRHNIPGLDQGAMRRQLRRASAKCTRGTQPACSAAEASPSHDTCLHWGHVGRLQIEPI